MARVVESWDQRKDVENDEQSDGTCEKCCDAGRGENELKVTFYKELYQDVRRIAQFVQYIY